MHHLLADSDAHRSRRVAPRHRVMLHYPREGVDGGQERRVAVEVAHGGLDIVLQGNVESRHHHVTIT